MFTYLNKRRKKGQSTLEYAVLIIIIIGALISIQVYIKRSIQGGLQSSADDIGKQFSPGNTNLVKIHKTTSYYTDSFKKGQKEEKLLNSEVSFDIMNQEIQVNDQEYWAGPQDR